MTFEQGFSIGMPIGLASYWLLRDNVRQSGLNLADWSFGRLDFLSASEALVAFAIVAGLHAVWKRRFSKTRIRL